MRYLALLRAVILEAREAAVDGKGDVAAHLLDQIENVPDLLCRFADMKQTWIWEGLQDAAMDVPGLLENLLRIQQDDFEGLLLPPGSPVPSGPKAADSSAVSAVELSRREVLTEDDEGGARHLRWLGVQNSELRSVDPLINPPTDAAGRTFDYWPVDREALETLGGEPTNGAYIQVAVPVRETAPTEVPTALRWLGYDITDGTRSLLVNHFALDGVLSGFNAARNRYGLFDDLSEARAARLVMPIVWRFEESASPQVWALYELPDETLARTA